MGELDKLIAKKRDIKQATMQQLLTGKKRLAGFSGEWEVKRLGEESELITKGTTPTSLGKNFTDSGINFIKIESLESNGDIIKDKVAFIDEETNNLLKRSQLKEKDILISIAGALGRVAIVAADLLPANTNQALAIVRLKADGKIHHQFLFYYLNSLAIRKYIEAINVQAAQANLSLENVNSFLILLPCLSEQTAIATILSDMDAEISQLEARRAKTAQLKQGMMQELLTGRIRLTIQEI
jgi:type I restriction enzyme S subunit